MAETVSQFEDIPGSYPSGGSDTDDALWQRIEAHCAQRWTPRQVVWIVDGPGLWKPPLGPATITQTEIWRHGAYEVKAPELSPFGGFNLHHHGPYRITATVGDNNPAPMIVLEAFERLKAYANADHGGLPGVSSYSVNTGQISESYRRNPAFMARALEMSGAADLLRGYRRA